jgi:hypothetical protein
LWALAAVAVLVVGVALAATGGGGDSRSTATTTSTPPFRAVTTTAPAPAVTTPPTKPPTTARRDPSNVRALCAQLENERKTVDAARKGSGKRFKNDKAARGQFKNQLAQQRKAIEERKQQASC